MKRNIKLVLMFGFLLALISGCTSNTEEQMINNDDMHDMHDMNNDMGMMHSVESEFEFLVEMIPHHQEAVDSSEDLLLYSENTELINLAQDVIEAQNNEITMMEDWLNQWYPNEDTQSNYQNMMPSLENSTENEANVKYIQGMIMHHQMAIMMAQSVLEVDNIRDEVRDLANDIIRVQNDEITQLKNILNNLE